MKEAAEKGAAVDCRRQILAIAALIILFHWCPSPPAGFGTDTGTETGTGFVLYGFIILCFYIFPISIEYLARFRDYDQKMKNSIFFIDKNIKA